MIFQQAELYADSDEETQILMRLQQLRVEHRVFVWLAIKRSLEDCKDRKIWLGHRISN
jgi:hypothetical protein